MSFEPDDLVDNDEANVVDEASNDDTITSQRYDISSYGADFDVEGLVRRLKKGDIFIPPFQRDYVWKITEASRFIESLLLGLPVPGIFLAREQNSNKLLIIDGQQRLSTLLFFYEGYFDPKPEEKKRRVFALTKVQKIFESKTYAILNEEDRIKLDDSIIHATIVKQDSPQNDDTSIYHIFERLNNGGRKLAPQEIRTALYHGSLINLLKALNENDYWRKVFGKLNNRLKDQELILRFLALYFNYEKYEKPMTEFLNIFASRYRDAEAEFTDKAQMIFISTIRLIWENLGSSAFRPEGSLNAAVFDSVMVGVARRIQDHPITDHQSLQVAYSQLLEDKDYKVAISQATSNEDRVDTRISKAIKAFSDIK